MLKPLQPSKFVERIITSQTGERYRVVFLVTLVNGEVRAKAISAELISTPVLKLGSVDSDGSVILSLPGASSVGVADTTYIFSYSPIVSPFTSLLFFTSQPTRAPSFN